MQNDPPTAYTPEPILIPALKVGALAGSAGVLGGGVTAVLRSSPTVKLFALGTGINCFALGSTYWAVRQTLYRGLQDPHATELTKFTDLERIYISGISGAVTGCTLGLLLRGRSNAIPGAMVWGLLGMGGQYAYNLADTRRTEDVIKQQSVSQVQQEGPAPSLWERYLRSRWSPVKPLTHEEYENLIKEKLLAVEADIAIMNEEIEKLKKLRDDRQDEE